MCLTQSSIEPPLADDMTFTDYVPNKPVAVIAGALYLLLGLGLLFRVAKRKDWWGVCLPIGAIGELQVFLPCLTHY